MLLLGNFPALANGIVQLIIVLYAMYVFNGMMLGICPIQKPFAVPSGRTMFLTRLLLNSLFMTRETVIPEPAGV
jgi:hypothetical protein